jgi:hypothetical protein
LFVNFAPMPNVKKVESAHVGNHFLVRLFLEEGGRERVLEGDFRSNAAGLTGFLAEWGEAGSACQGLIVHNVEARLVR